MMVSFIIPSFNAGKTMERCLESIFSLDMQGSEYEVIVIDDASTDNTVEIIEKNSLIHENLTLICQTENHRQGAARNRGLAVAKGDFVVFVDSDDEVAPGVISAIKLCHNLRLDMVAMNVVYLGEKGEICKETKQLNDNVFSGKELQTEHPYWFAGPVGYVYRKDFLDKTGYPFAEDVLFEDSDFVNIHLYYAERMSYCGDCCYIVHYNQTSTTHTISFKHISDYAILGNRMLAFYQDRIEDKSTKYAESILEGGSFNIMRSFKNVFKLHSVKEVRSFYGRLNSYLDRDALLKYKEPAYCWTHWTRFCLRYPNLSTLLIGVSIYLLMPIRFIKNYL